MRLRVTRRMMAGVLLLVLLGAACAGGSDQADGGMSEEAGDQSGGGADAFKMDEDAAREAPQAARAQLGYSGGDTGEGLYDSDAPEMGSAAVDVPGVGPRVIKTGDISVEVPRGELSSALQRGRTVADKHGGYILSTYTEGDRADSGSFTMKVPADRFEEAMSDLEDLGEVTAEAVEGKDVSQEFVDLSARLRHLVAQETVMLELMKKAVTIQDTIRVQHELQNIQMEIERLRGRLRYLRSQTSLSTISVSLREAGTTPPKTGMIGKAFRKALDGAIRVVSGVIVATGFLIPIALIAALIFMLGRALLPRVKTIP